jgi:hypothetical protein
MVISRSHVAMSDLLDHFPDLTTRYEVCFERRWHQRRIAPAPQDGDRRQHDRRQRDISDKLRRDGWVIVPGVSRGM